MWQHANCLCSPPHSTCAGVKGQARCPSGLRPEERFRTFDPTNRWNRCAELRSASLLKHYAPNGSAMTMTMTMTMKGWLFFTLNVCSRNCLGVPSCVSAGGCLIVCRLLQRCWDICAILCRRKREKINESLLHPEKSELTSQSQAAEPGALRFGRSCWIWVL